MATEGRDLVRYEGALALRIKGKDPQPAPGAMVEAWEHARGPQHVTVVREIGRNKTNVYYAFEKL